MYVLFALLVGIAFLATLVIAVRALARLVDGPPEEG